MSVIATLGRILTETWNITAVMSPYLLLGFAAAGVLFVLLPRSWVVAHLGGRGWVPSLKAALFGVPLPLCSCGVIPVTASLRQHGAGRGPTAAFLMSTPQTGVDSIVATYGLLGPLFAVVRPLVAFVSGALCGVLVDHWAPDRNPAPPAAGDAGSSAIRPPAWKRMVRFALVTLPGDLRRPLLLGLLISGLLGALVPPQFFAGRFDSPWLQMLAMMLLGIPLYVCSTASIPIALGLMHSGISAGAVLVFLITGPATNAAALATLWRILGRRAAGIYLAVLAGSALLAGAILDRWVLPDNGSHVCHHGFGEPAALWQHVGGLVLIGLLVGPLLFRRRTA